MAIYEQRKSIDTCLHFLRADDVVDGHVKSACHVYELTADLFARHLLYRRSFGSRITYGTQVCSEAQRVRTVINANLSTRTSLKILSCCQ